MNTVISKYKLTGNVSCWQILENKNYPLWNIACNEEGRRSLLKALELMINDPFSSKLKLPNTSPIHLGLIWMHSLPKWKFFDTLTIHHNTNNNHISSTTILNSHLVISFDTQRLRVFTSHIRDRSFDLSMILQGNETTGFW